MKNKKEFRPLGVKIFLRTTATLAAAVAVVSVVWSVVLRGSFADGMVTLLQLFPGMTYEAALSLYERIFRSHRDAVILLSIVLVSAGLFLMFLRWLTRYFEAVSEGLDALLSDAPGEISLPPELLPLERKMNLAKHRIILQKSEMRMAEQRKNDLMMYLAHDLKTPLASTISYLSLLRDEKQISEELREKYLSVALTKSRRLEDLIDEFLEIARYSLSSITLQYTQINLTRLLEQLLYEFQPVLDRKGLTCRLVAAVDIQLKCDADRMQRVFDNLLRNAASYSDDGTEIVVEAREEDDALVLKFSNRGEAIPKERLERIFEQFYRLNTGRSSKGTGLGLAVARQIVALHNGTIAAESEDGRTVFTVTLPASGPQEACAPAL